MEHRHLMQAVPLSDLVILLAATLRGAHEALVLHKPRVLLFSSHSLMGHLLFENDEGKVTFSSRLIPSPPNMSGCPHSQGCLAAGVCMQASIEQDADTFAKKLLWADQDAEPMPASPRSAGRLPHAISMAAAETLHEASQVAKDVAMPVVHAAKDVASVTARVFRKAATREVSVSQDAQLAKQRSTSVDGGAVGTHSRSKETSTAEAGGEGSGTGEGSGKAEGSGKGEGFGKGGRSGKGEGSSSVKWGSGKWGSGKGWGSFSSGTSKRERSGSKRERSGKGDRSSRAGRLARFAERSAKSAAAMSAAAIRETMAGHTSGGNTAEEDSLADSHLEVVILAACESLAIAEALVRAAPKVEAIAWKTLAEDDAARGASIHKPST
jgi:hypothetical protein